MSTPILRDFPDRILTERLLIRAPQPGDGDENCTAVRESMAELRPWMPWADENMTPETQEAVMRRAHADFMARTDLMLLLLLKGTNTIVGSSGLHQIDWRVPKFEIGYWVRSRIYDSTGTRRVAEMLLNHATLKHSYAGYAEAAK